MRPNPTDFFSEEAYNEACEEAMRPAATEADAIREYVRNVGYERPDSAWIITPYDTWERNPFYVGPPVRHPEDDSEDVYDPVDKFDSQSSANDDDCPF